MEKKATEKEKRVEQRMVMSKDIKQEDVGLGDSIRRKGSEGGVYKVNGIALIRHYHFEMTPEEMKTD